MVKPIDTPLKLPRDCVMSKEDAELILANYMDVGSVWSFSMSVGFETKTLATAIILQDSMINQVFFGFIPNQVRTEPVLMREEMIDKLMRGKMSHV